MTLHCLTLHFADSADMAIHAASLHFLFYQWDFLQFVERHLCWMLILCQLSWRWDSEISLEERAPCLN